jgi:HAD superfamily hydrolase (TIGR01509 family)
MTGSETTGDTVRTHAVLFDIDGTLIDSNYLHIDAWSRAFADVGFPVDSSRIHWCIGMDSGKLLEELLGDKVDEVGEKAKKRHTHHYMAMTDRLRAFTDARELLTDLDGRGVSVVLATSAPEKELKPLRKELHVEDDLVAVTSSEDVETAKPDPDIVKVALKKAGTQPGNTIMVGDSVWDIASAKRAGVDCIGVLTGGTSKAQLIDAGAVAVYDDVAHLLREVESSPLARLWS